MNLRSIFQKNKLKEKFTSIYLKNTFKGKESLSGTGSDLIQTSIISVKIPELLKNLNTKVLIDAPCGDFYWMNHVELLDINYIGLDIVEEIISKNINLYGNSNRQFLCANIVTDKIPNADVILIRDCFVHLNNEDIYKCIMNLKRSNIKYLLTTSFPGLTLNKELTSIWRPINLELSPYNFPTPNEIINEGCTENEGLYSDKSLMIWEISKLPVFNA